MKITAQQLKNIAPFAKPDTIDAVVLHFNSLNDVYGINTPVRAAHFFAQLIHESGSFRHTQEIADGSAYEGRKDLGNIHPGDGKKYKGHGYIQVTGRINHAECSWHIFKDRQKLLDHPEMLSTPRYAMQSAMWFWTSRDLNTYADKPEDWTRSITWRKKTRIVTKFEYITYRVNGGFNGIIDRQTHFSLASAELLKHS